MSKDANRKSFPTVAQMVDEWRSKGFDVKVVWCKEGQKEMGVKPEEREVFTIPAYYRTYTGEKK